MIINHDTSSLFPHMLNISDSLSYGKWQTKFILLKKINEQWVFCRNVQRRRHKFTMMEGGPLYDYAVNDLELIQKSNAG